MFNTMHWHVMVGDNPNIVNVEVEFTDLALAVNTFVGLTQLFMPEQYKEVDWNYARENTMNFLMNSWNENVVSQQGEHRIVIAPCTGCLTRHLN